ncbi:MAG TPA: hypothetical protein VFL58_02980 [Gaiellaceae bacterium]|nr:hypothetical protein [Gaiellaceae bacterium]
MAATVPFQLGQASLGQGMSLIVVDHDGVQYEIKTSGDAAQYLAGAWGGTLEELSTRELVAYSPEVVIRAGEGRALVINDDLREENEVIEELLADGDRPQVKPSDVSGELYLYAVVSDAKAGRIAMIKKKNPTKRARAGKALFAAGDELRGLEQDPWELDPLFDLVVSAKGGFALNTFFFEQLFADAERLRAKIGPWVGDIAKRLPMSQGSRDLLVAECDASPRLRRRLRAIAHRGHLGRVTLADIRRHTKEMGLPTTQFIKNNQLIVDEDNIAELLRILNEDLTRGGLTRDRFRIESKEPM